MEDATDSTTNLADGTEPQVFRIRVDPTKCRGYGNCVNADPERFDLDDAGRVVIVREVVSGSAAEAAAVAVRSCPVKAIWLESDG